ncbi:MAG: hypothetical protein HRT65_10565 [Flavobacteriaceae bacterium]|uniref:plastocyanin/azurin family copper-binding protein n=1 Tax=Flagellimonas algarum TaxID=3230298 RepID=UPI0033975F15|nr:hypothetical protein [Flavobacteriaceae bacterium]
MRKVVLAILFVVGVAFNTNAQDSMAKVIKLEQTPGEFTQKSLTVKEGTYTFEISNVGVDHNVGFVLVKQGDDISKPENHIQTAYVTAPVGTDETQSSKPTTLEKGTYVYFCPLNPTATDNTLVVE